MPVYTVSLETVRAKVMKWGLPEESTRPDPYLGDFFGVQRLSDGLTLAALSMDLVPEHAEIVPSEDDSVLRLRFKDGWQVDFYIDATLRVDTDAGEFEHRNFAVVQNTDSAENERPFVQRLQTFLQDNGLAERYLQPNPYYQEELLAAEALENGGGLGDKSELGSFEAFKQEQNAVYLLPDAVHGDPERYATLVQLLAAPEVDWIAIEMLDVSMQDELQVFMKGEASTEAWQEARGALLAYYERSWNRFGDATPEQNHYFRLLEMARESHKGAYALDTELEYTFFRYGEFPLGATARHVVWAKQFPGTGRGLVFGGSGHMSRGAAANIQHFIRTLQPGTAIYHHYVEHAP